MVGPAQIVGPIPLRTPEPDFDEDLYNRDRNNKSIAIPILVAVICALAAVVLMFISKKKVGAKKPQKTEEIYHAKQHRHTEEHRHYEERRKFEDRRKYAQRGKYKGRR